MSTVPLASGGPCQGGGRAQSARTSLSLSLPLSENCPSGQDPPEAPYLERACNACFTAYNFLLLFFSKEV